MVRGQIYLPSFHLPCPVCYRNNRLVANYQQIREFGASGQISPLTPENTAAEGWNRYTDGGRLLGLAALIIMFAKGNTHCHPST